MFYGSSMPPYIVEITFIVQHALPSIFPYHSFKAQKYHWLSYCNQLCVGHDLPGINLLSTINEK